MMLLNTSLLRERFTITEKDDSHKPIGAFGNRILLPLHSKNGEITERIVIRAHSMHMALYMAAALTKIFFDKGPVMHYMTQEKWKDMWFDVCGDFERPHNDKTWVSVYHKGRPIYQDGDHHAFLDIIEQCDIKNRDEYDRAIPMAVDIFKQAGRNVDIDYDVNIAAVIGITEHRTRCGLILRSPTRTTTFNLSMQMNKDKELEPHPQDGLELSAAYLEAIQLSTNIHFVNGRITDGKVSETSPEALYAKASYNRIGRLNNTIQTFETLYDIRYRPEKPDFKEIIRGVDG